jgi:hypothetical protein
MPDKSKKQSPPYSTFSSYISFTNKLRETVVPNRIDSTVFGNASGSMIYSVIASLKFLNQIDDNGIPSPQFIQFVKAPDNERPELLREIIQQGYPTLFSGKVDLTKISAGEFDTLIRDQYDVSGSTIDKIAAFFIAAAKAAEIPISTFLEKRAPISSSSSSKKSAQQRKKAESTDDDDNDPPPPPLSPPMSEKALEYRLVDLMSEAADDDAVMGAIITVITFLKTKNAKKPANKQEAGGEED